MPGALKGRKHEDETEHEDEDEDDAKMEGFESRRDGIT